MMTTNLFVIANVKQLWTLVVLVLYFPFFQTHFSVCALNSAIFKTFHIHVDFGKILEEIRIFSVFEHP